ncbi:MAG: HNH endonuclease [Proteobacteria bacterium]|nr:HNH endonuclease [Pseudomonadota bacterium]MBU4294287.1 HNH endonuclease [Pseudomonadota bacterium]MCG2749760.1 HNH endonuclease [Desulfobulbaceae bacterium]
MVAEDYGFTGVDEQVIKKEKAKARDLRRTSWWKNKIAAGICYYCGRKFPLKELTMDHLIPLARGGTSSKGNIVAACKECNTRKKTLLPLEWEEYMTSLDRHES